MALNKDHQHRYGNHRSWGQSSKSTVNLNETDNIVHPDWEIIDPVPDVNALFSAFDTRFFQGKLKCVTLEWSKRMYSCAGICYSRKDKRFGFASCTIRLSEPLLKLRSRRDLVQTLLHEMIHAYLFVNNIREGNGGHGPNFIRIMTSINRTAGTNITVYHTFNEEVQHYRTHIWRCNGVCQHRTPFFGYVRRTSNRAPGPNDNWWLQHHETCGGYFEKISEPEKIGKKSASTTRKTTSLGGISSSTPPITGQNSTKGIASYFPIVKKTQSEITQSSTTQSSTTNRTKTYGNASNVHGFNDFNTNPTGSHRHNKHVNTDLGKYLGSAVKVIPLTINNAQPLDTVRNVWSKKFPSSTVATSKTSTEITSKQTTITKPTAAAKTSTSNVPSDGSNALKNEITSKYSIVNSEISKWNEIDNDIAIKEIILETINLSDDDEDSKQNIFINNKLPEKKIIFKPCGDDDDLQMHESICETIEVMDSSSNSSDDNLKAPEKELAHLNNYSNNSDEKMKESRNSVLTVEDRQLMIKNEIIDDVENDIETEDIIEIIDDEYNESLANLSNDLFDTSVIDDLFGNDTLTTEFNNINSAMLNDPDHNGQHNLEIITCPICDVRMSRESLDDHLDGCGGILKRVVVKYANNSKLAENVPEVFPKQPRTRYQRKQTTAKPKVVRKLLPAPPPQYFMANQTDGGDTSDNNNNSINEDSSRGSNRRGRHVTTKRPISAAAVATASKSGTTQQKRTRPSNNSAEKKVQCPICYELVAMTLINSHLDLCVI